MYLPIIKLPYIIRLVLLLLIFVQSGNLYAQTTKIRGRVSDASNNEGIPFVNVSFKGKPTGTITSETGSYFLETREKHDSLTFSFVGYQSQTVPIKPNTYQEIYIQLEPISINIKEVKITPGVNPAHIVLRKIIASKDRHNPKKLDSYSYRAYNKLQLDINNVNESFQKQRVFKHFQFIFDYIDTSAMTGKAYLPVFITESFSDYYFQRNPRKEKEIITATKIAGFDNKSLAQFTGKMYQKINIYNNFVSVFEPGFISPISDFGLLYYKYYLLDSAYIDNHWCYQISFTPKREQERTFRGNLWVNDTSFAIKKIDMRIANDANFNFVNDFSASYIYEPVKDSIWFLTREKLIIDFNISNQTTGFFGRKLSTYSNISINNKIPERAKRMNDNIKVAGKALKREEKYWANMRPEQLSRQEEEIYLMVDSVQQIPAYNRYEKLVAMFAMYHYEIGPLELGPYYKLYSYNEREGHRFRFGMRSSNQFSKKIMPAGHIAYGLKDEKWKYGASILYVPVKQPRFSLGFSYRYDMRQLGQSKYALTEDNIFTSLLRRNPNTKLTLTEEIEASIEKEWFQGFTQEIFIRRNSIFSNSDVSFVQSTASGQENIGSITTTEIEINNRFAKNEKYLRGEFERIRLGTDMPVVNIRLTAGLKDFMGGEYSYYKLKLSMHDKIRMSPLGYFYYKMEGGQIFGEVPYPLLHLHPGNETYAYDKHAYNMMNYYEFGSDRYLSLHGEYHFQGFFFNKIPLVRKLKLREVVGGKILWGEIQQNHESIISFPDNFHELDKPYYEVQAGIENILKIFRLDAIWRLSYRNHPNIETFGLRLGMQIIF